MQKLIYVFHVPNFINFTFIHTQLIPLMNLYRSQHNLFTIALVQLLHFSNNEITVLFSWFSRIHHIVSTMNHTWITIYYYFSTTEIFFSWVFNGIQSMLFHLVDDLLLFSAYIGWMWMVNHVVVEDYRSSFFTLYSIQFDNEY